MRANINTTTDIYGNVGVREADCPLNRTGCNTVNFSCEHFEGCNGSGTRGRCKKLLEQEKTIDSHCNNNQ